MPTYEYECQKCGHRFEKFQSMAAKPLTKCPEELCAQKPWGKGKVSRVIGAGAGIIFKGSGFYITDYRSEKYKEAAKKETSTASSSSSAPSTASSSAETKPKKESKPSGGASSKPATG